MYELKTNTAVRIAVGPLVDPTDGKTAETALTVTGMVVDILQMDNDGTAVNRTSFSPTASGGNNDMVYVTNDTVGMYDLELTAAQLNYLGNVRLVFYDVDGFLVHWIDLQLVSAAYFDWKYGTTLPNVNVTQISGDSTAADNCELMFDGTGYAGGTTKLKVDLETIKTQAVTCAGGVTVPAATLASTTNITAASGVTLTATTGLGNQTANITGTITTATNLTNAPPDSSGVTTLLSRIVGTLAAGTHNAQTGDSYAIVNSGTYGNSALKTLIDTIDDFLDTEIAAILADTNELQTDWVNGGRLDLLIDAIKAKTDTIPASPAAVGSAMTLANDSVTAAAIAADAVTEIQSGLATAAELAKVPKSDSNVTWNATALASVKAEVVGALNTDTYAEPGQGNPPATASIEQKLGYMYKNWRNKKTQTSSEWALYADDGTTKDQEAAVSDDGTTTTKGE